MTGLGSLLAALYARAFDDAADFALCCGLQDCSPSMLKALSAGFDAEVTPGLRWNSGFRRRSTTRRLGPYRDRTFTGKHITACSGHTHSRMPLSGIQEVTRSWIPDRGIRE